MIKIIGTTHLMSKESIEGIIKDESPDIIGVELCELRLNLMVINPPIEQEKKEDNSLIGKISNKIKEKAEKENLAYGSDMITASKYALDNKIQLELLDRDLIEIKNLMEKIPKEELSFFLKELGELENVNLKESTKNINADKILEDLKVKAPISFEILITSRDLFIAVKILKLMCNYPNKRILVFLGKGHLKSINKLIGMEVK